MLPQSFAEALALAKERKPTPNEIQRVAESTSPEAARWAFTQWGLRARATMKFSDAERMLFVREALEQATHEAVAAYHASRFPEGVLVADIGCGIGGDLIAFARRGPVVGYELDRERAAYARYNLATLGLAAEVRGQNGVSALGEFDYVFADPARRLDGKRIVPFASYRPDPRSLAQAGRAKTLMGIKLSTLMSDVDLAALGVGVEFVSFGGECREALLWTGEMATPGFWAVQVESGERLERTTLPAAVPEPGRFLFEADPAVIRAHALGALAERHGVLPLGDSKGYLTGDHRTVSPWLTTYEVLATVPLREDEIRSALGQLGAKVDAIKSRARLVDLARWRRRVAGPGREPVVLVMFPVGHRIRAAIVRPAS